MTLNLFWRILGYKEEQKQNESLTALMHLRNPIVANGIEIEYAPRIFNAYIDGVFKTDILNAYGSDFIEERKHTDKDLYYEFSKDGIKISYSASPVLVSSLGSALYSSVLSVEQEKIDIKSAGFFINSLLETNIIVYNGDFMIFHRKGENMIKKSHELLDELNIHAEDAISFAMAPGTAGIWQYVKFARD